MKLSSFFVWLNLAMLSSRTAGVQELQAFCVLRLICLSPGAEGVAHGRPNTCKLERLFGFFAVNTIENYEFAVRRWESDDRFARGYVLAKHARGFQQVLMAQESQDTLSLFILAPEVEMSQKLLW